MRINGCRHYTRQNICLLHVEGGGGGRSNIYPSPTGYFPAYPCSYSQVRSPTSMKKNKQTKHLYNWLRSSHRFQYNNFTIIVQVKLRRLSSAIKNILYYRFWVLWKCSRIYFRSFFKQGQDQVWDTSSHIVLADFPQQRFIVFTQINLRHAVPNYELMSPQFTFTVVVLYLNEQRFIYLKTYIFEKNDTGAMLIQCQNLPEMSESLGIQYSM